MWNDIKTHPPINGDLVFVKLKTKYETAYYCEGEFYYLKYDNILGVLRKEHLEEPVTAWSYTCPGCPMETA